MGRFDEIKNKINANINENGEQRITGQVLNEVLIDEVNTIDEVITELEESIGQGGGGGITEEKEVYIGEEEPTDDGAKLWIDPTGTPSGGNGGGLETRILYIPEVTAGSELTDEEKAYNVETCQKLLAGNARALISVGGLIGVVTESAFNLSAIGGVGTLVDFNWAYAAPLPTVIIGDDGDILMTMESAMSPITLSEEGSTDSSLYWSLLYSSMASKTPMIWFDFKDSFWLATKCDFSGSIISYEAVCKDIEFKKPLNATLKVIVSITNYVVSEYKTTQCIYVGQSLSSDEQSYNSIWMDSLSNIMSVEKPMVRISGNDEAEYSLIGFTKHLNEGKANVTIYRNGAFETWQINKDGTTTQIAE